LSRGLDDAGYETLSKTSSFWKNTDQGAATMVVAAYDPALTGTNHPSPYGSFDSHGLAVSDPSAVYLSDCQFAKTAPHAVNMDSADRLYRLSEELVGIKFAL
jgi:hypothetical protein